LKARFGFSAAEAAVARSGRQERVQPQNKTGKAAMRAGAFHERVFLVLPQRVQAAMAAMPLSPGWCATTYLKAFSAGVVAFVFAER
jgi:hypothetical protein